MLDWQSMPDRTAPTRFQQLPALSEPEASGSLACHVLTRGVRSPPLWCKTRNLTRLWLRWRRSFGELHHSVPDHSTRLSPHGVRTPPANLQCSEFCGIIFTSN